MGFIDKLLTYYSLSYEDYEKLLNSSIKDVKDFNAFKHSKEIVSYLKNAIAKNKKILIYGDYDCDGIMATSIVYLTLQSSTFTPGYYIPSREPDGYGITKENIDKFHQLGYEILILVDNGISTIDEIAYANSLGMECIVFDHHTLLNNLPDAKFIMHPDVDNYGPYNISAGEVSFFFSWAYLGRIDEYLLVLAMISTIGDVMPIKEYNKILVKTGLDYLNNSSTYDFKAIKNLINSPQIDNYIFTEEDISRMVVPKINSICRILNDNSRFNIVKYFTSGRHGLNDNLLYWINEINDKRKHLLEEAKHFDLKNDQNAILYINKSLEGISGLIASSLLNEYKKPTFVICETKENSKIYKGSARSYPGFNIAETLHEAEDLLEAYGGHESAGGFTIKEENIDKFHAFLNEKASKRPIKSPKKETIEITENEINLENYNLIRTLAPYGEGFKAPLFKIKNLARNRFVSDRFGKHLFLRFDNGDSMVYFNYDKNIDNLETFSAIGTFKLNYFRGKISTQFIIEEVE